jgi:hypothetical protein
MYGSNFFEWECAMTLSLTEAEIKDAQAGKSYPVVDWLPDTASDVMGFASSPIEACECLDGLWDTGPYGVAFGEVEFESGVTGDKVVLDAYCPVSEDMAKHGLTEGMVVTLC